jgi:hypothetical protein
MDKDLLRDRFAGQAMNSLHKVAVLAAVALIGSVGAISLQSKVFAAVDPNDLEKFKELTTNFEKDVSDAAQKNNSDEIKTLLDEFNRNVTMIFELKTSDIEADPPGEADPPDPDTEPPTPDKS